MRKVGSREFKNRQGYYLQRVRRGETLLVTDRGKPVARVVPATEWDALTMAEKVDELARQGHVRKGRGECFRRVRPVPLRGKPLSEIILEDRG